jgi:4-hydroxy-2-oxoheptanedioate aldolase
MAHQGYDWICIDMQHGVVDYQVAVTMLQAIGATATIPFVRVPWNEQGIIGKVLDAGALGVIIPMVNSVEEAKAAVASCRYYPLGSRSYGPTRAAYYAGAGYYPEANEQVACVPMIETKQAVERLDDILSVPGIDAVYVGPADLSITLGQQPRMDKRGRSRRRGCGLRSGARP